MTAGCKLFRSDALKKLAYIDAVRGWAILLVFSCHVGGHFASMPYPLKKLTNFGIYGVQLFFLASALTLSMSWHQQNKPYFVAVKDFFIRRYLRIAPLYYAASGIYFFSNPPASGFKFFHWLQSAIFINTWYPDWLPTTKNWVVVPGGWTIGVEFTFYFLFPIAVLLVRNLRDSALMVVFCTMMAVVSHEIGVTWLNQFDKDEVESFLYFWFPNQAPVFALGILLYFIIKSRNIVISSRTVIYLVVVLIAPACIIIAEYPSSHTTVDTFTIIPSYILASLVFMVFIFILAKGSPSIIVHPLVQRLGVISFSCYIFHFLAIDTVIHQASQIIDINAVGLMAPAMFLLLFVPSFAGTIIVATIAHKFVEQPGINLARWLTSSRQAYQTSARSEPRMQIAGPPGDGP